MTSDIATSRQRLRTPRAAAVAGILFATSLNTLALTLVLPSDRWAGALIPLSAALVWAAPHWRDRSRTEVRVDHSTTF